MEEGFEQVFKILEDFENPDTVNELLKEIQENQKATEERENKWKNGDKEKYPSTYLLQKLTEKVYEELSLPKEALCKLVDY